MSSEPERLFDPLMLPQYLRLNLAIEQYTADRVEHDPGTFRSGRVDIRYVAERQLFFALVADRKLFEYFVAVEAQTKLPNEDTLTVWGRMLAPYFRQQGSNFGKKLDLKSRVLRYFHRTYGRASIKARLDDVARPQFLFLVIHLKFVRYLLPIANKLGASYAFLTVDDQSLFEAIGRQNLPCIHLELTPQSVEMTRSETSILGAKFKPGIFDSWFIMLNAVQRAFKEMAPVCVVIPEGNAAIYELVNQSAKALEIPTVCIQQGWAPVIHPGFRNMTYTKMCVWGEEFVKMLTPYNPGQHFVATGSHVIECRSQGEVGRRKAVAFFLQNGAHWISEAVWNSTFDLIAWTATTFPDYEIRVREHPGEPLRAGDMERLVAARAKLMSPNEFSLRAVFSGCRVAVGMTSSTILEAVASGVVPLILDVVGFGPYYPDLADHGAAVEVRNFNDARRELARLLNDDRFCASFEQPLVNARHRLFARDGDLAIDAIVAEVRDAM